MNFAVRFFKSLYSFNEYNKMIKDSFLKAAFNVFIVSLIAMVMLAAPFFMNYLRLEGVTGVINRYVPEFTLKDGILSTDKYYKKEIDELSLLIIDTKSAYTQDDLLKYETGFIITNDRIITKLPTGDIVEHGYNEIEEQGITCKQDVIKLVPVIKVYLVLFVIMLIGFIFIENMFYAAVFAIIMNIVNIRRKVSLNMAGAIKISCYAISTPILFKGVLNCIDIFVGGGYGFSMPTVIHFGVMGAFCFFALKAVKADILREEKEKKGASLNAAAEKDR